MSEEQEHDWITTSPDPCVGELHPAARAGLELFNAGEYFEAHEALETAWREETGSVRDLYRGILQVGVAYHHILRGNYTGAVKMFRRSRQWLDLFPDRCRGIDLSVFRQDLASAEQALLRLGAERIAWFDRSLLRPIRYQA